MPHRFQAAMVPSIPAGTRVAPQWRVRAFKVLVIGLWLTMALAAWRELEPLLIFRKVDGVCVWAERRPVTMKTRTPSGGRRRRSGYVPEATFRYQVGGAEYLSSTFSRMPMMESGRKVGRRMNGVSTGVKITAWYNPFNPSDAVIDRTPNPIWLGIIAMGCVFCAILWRFAEGPRSRRMPRGPFANSPAGPTRPG